jgi:hypothetical protein
MKTKILRKTFVNVGVLFALTRLLAAGTSDGALNFSDSALLHPQPTLITFDPPGPTGTFPMGINPAGVITGTYTEAGSGEGHGFLRARDGSFTTFDIPGAVNGTFPVGINDGGEVTGIYVDATLAAHSFVRAPDGTFATFDPGMVPNLSGIINPAGAITGYFFLPLLLFSALCGIPREPSPYSMPQTSVRQNMKALLSV